MSLESKLTVFEWLTFIGTALVLLGLVKEYGLSGLLEVLSIWKRKDRDSRIKVETWSERVGAVFVVLGIGVELIGGVGVFKTSLRIESHHRREIENLRAANLALQRDADLVRSRIASTNERAAAAERDAAIAKAHAADLEVVTYGRPISDRLKSAILTACEGKFKTREISIGSSVSDDPATLLALELKTVLDKAQFKQVNDNIGREMFVGAIGVVITGDPNDGFVTTLYDTLGSTHELIPVMHPKPNWMLPVQIFVGARPFMPPSGETPEWREFLRRHNLSVR
jgi:hypothetical protein